MANHAHGGKAKLEAQPRQAQHGERAQSGAPAGSFYGASPFNPCCKSDPPSGALLSAFTGLPPSASGEFFQIYFIAMSFCLPVCLHIVFIDSFGALGHQKRRSNPPGNALQMIIRHTVGAGNQIHVICKNKSS